MPDQGGPAGQQGSSRGGRGNRGGRGRERGRGRGRGGPGRAPAPDSAAPVATPNQSNQAENTNGPEGPSQGADRNKVRGRNGRGHGHRRGRGHGERFRGHGPNRNNAIQDRYIPGTRRAFGGHLTTQEGAQIGGTRGNLSGDAPEFVPGQPITTRPRNQDQPPQRRMPKSIAPDLTTRIHDDISNMQYECVICTDNITRTSKIWAHEGGCWTVVHVSCVKAWFKKADRELENGALWRCPGCNSQIEQAPKHYTCWCGKEINPGSTAGLPPHSCGQTCSKIRGKCPHPCPMQCHAGPCPPCSLMGPPEQCFCAKHTSIKRCIETDYENGWSCGEVCGDLLPCGRHTCQQSCHGGLCGICDIPTPSICYCGKTQKTIPCELRADPHQSFNHGQVKLDGLPDQIRISGDGWFEGFFQCNEPCGRVYGCGKHSCGKKCHARGEEAPHCPYSPDVVQSCPCGKTALTQLLDRPRETCEDEIPHCDKVCGRMLACGHRCQKACHADSCGPCFETVDISCRCGRAASRSICLQGREVEPPMCMRVCRILRNCGRHECGERCCSGEKRAMERRKAKNTNINDIEPEHICLRVCDKLLKCGKHRCQQACHKGPCNTCLEAVFEEIRCPCGKTVLQPPQPCGTGPPECRYNCTRPKPCGHEVSHTCHADDVPCPKCPFLVSRNCMCGKQTMFNQPCWLMDVRCGKACGKKLKCGAHECRKLCHRPGECEDSDPGARCTQPCGRSRKFCDHACTEHCHAPLPCKEDKPCQSKAIILCPCQNLKRETKCLACLDNPYPARKTLECDGECLRLQRNKRLAEALQIDPTTHSNDHVPFSSQTLKMFAANQSWCQEKEREFRLFAADGQLKRKRFDPMLSHERAFLHSLATDFGFDTLSEDPEPYRHVSVFKTPRFVGPPMKTLAQALKIQNSKAKPASVASTFGSEHNAAASSRQEPYNALLLSGARFGLTSDELDSVLMPELEKHASNVIFTSFFLDGHDVVIRASSKATAPWRKHDTEGIITDLKPVIVSLVVGAHKLAESVTLCAADLSGNVVKKERRSVIGTWNTIASRGNECSGSGASRGMSPSATARSVEKKPGAGVRGSNKWALLGGSSFASMSSVPSSPLARSTGYVALKLKKKQKEVEEPVEESWETAAEKVELESRREDGHVENEIGGNQNGQTSAP